MRKPKNQRTELRKRQEKTKSKLVKSRQQFKNLTVKEQKEFLYNKGLSYATVNKLSPTERAFKAFPKTKADYRREKRDLLHENFNIPYSVIDTARAKDIDHFKLKELKNGVVPASIPPIFKKYVIDYDRNIILPKDGKIFLAFRSFTGEISFKSILAYYHKKSNAELLAETRYFLQLEPLFSMTGSNGFQGEFKMQVGDRELTTETRQDQRKTEFENLKKKSHKKRRHTGIYNKWQYVSNSNDYGYITEITCREALLLYCAFANNITEMERINLNNYFYFDVFKYFPDLMVNLPDREKIVLSHGGGTNVKNSKKKKGTIKKI